MKPRNKAERDVARLSHSLKIRKADMEWIEKKHTAGETEYFAIFERKGDWQVIRMFMYRCYSKRKQILHEPLRFWIKSNGTYEIESKNRQCLGNWYIDAWCINSELALRSFDYKRDVRRVGCSHAKIHSLIPQLKRTGLNAKDRYLTDLMPFFFVSELLTNNRLETFYKLNQFWLVWKFYFYDRLSETLWQSIRVALRHGYHWDTQKDINDWCDMINMMEYCGADTHNPQLICPANLKEAHDMWNNRRYHISELKRIAQEIKNAEAYEPFYQATREQFADMVLVDKRLKVQVIPTAKGIIEEGHAMHHCVGGYYNRPNSLILSATINGKRKETIEVNLATYTIVQCRGLQNKSTKYHKRILELVKANLDLIRVLDVNHKDIEKRKINKLKKAV